MYRKQTGSPDHTIAKIVTLTHVAGYENTIANLLSCCTDLNKGVNTNQPHVLLSPTLFSNIYDANPLRNQKIFLNDNPEIQWQILQQLHNSPVGSHPDISNTWDLVKWSYEGPRLHEFVEEYVKGCVKCQESKTNLPQLNTMFWYTCWKRPIPIYIHGPHHRPTKVWKL